MPAPVPVPVPVPVPEGTLVGTVTVELFGMPLLLAGERQVRLPWRPGLRLADLPALLAEAEPALRERVVQPDGALAGGLAFNRNGREFVRDPLTPVDAGDHLLLISADPGG